MLQNCKNILKDSLLSSDQRNGKKKLGTTDQEVLTCHRGFPVAFCWKSIISGWIRSHRKQIKFSSTAKGDNSLSMVCHLGDKACFFAKLYLNIATILGLEASEV